MRKNLARMEERVIPLEKRCTFAFVNLNLLEAVARKVGYPRIGLCAHFYGVYFVGWDNLYIGYENIIIYPVLSETNLK